MNDAYQQLMERVRDLGRLQTIGQLLDWDQEVLMPSGGTSARAEQLSLIAGLAHEQLISDETGKLLTRAAADDGDAIAQTNLRETMRSFERAVKVPTALVKEIARASSLAKDAWVKARSACDFSLFSDHLARMVDLKKRLADAIGYETEAYDALMDEFEPGAKAKDVESLFASLRKEIVALLEKVQAAPDKPDASILTRHFPRARQEVLSQRLAEAIGFDFESGRADVSVHPFCTTIGGGGDVRITTRYLEDFLPSSIFGTLHEVGHALYEQGLLNEHRFTPMAEAISLGIHESQSRMWENMVGRSRAFWEYHYDELQRTFSDALDEVSLDEFYRAINAAAPSFIRVEADELTYNLHIILRFEIERGLFTDRIKVADVPKVWNERFQAILGITPPDDAKGCLQDIHWSMGAFGYFPTYTLGNLYAAQFYEQARKDIPDLDGCIRRNEHQPLLSWLRENIHRHGRRYRAHELVERVTGRALSIKPFVAYVNSKFGEVYGLSN